VGRCKMRSTRPGRCGGISERDRALVIGAGTIGLDVALFAKQSGAAVTLMDINAIRLAGAASTRSIALMDTIYAPNRASASRVRTIIPS
jgi:threonine dehydrogenase-like Zn-dependent dehydrogenase